MLETGMVPGGTRGAKSFFLVDVSSPMGKNSSLLVTEYAEMNTLTNCQRKTWCYHWLSASHTVKASTSQKGGWN